MGEYDRNNNNIQDDQEGETEAEAAETISLTDFPITTQDHEFHDSQDDHLHRQKLSSPSSEFFEFSCGGLADYSEEKIMSHAEDIIFCGKLVPINEQRHHQPPPEETQRKKQKQKWEQLQPLCCRRSESMSELKSTASTTTSRLTRNSRSLDYKKLNRNSSLSSEPATEIHRNVSGKKLTSYSISSSSSRWYVLMFGLVMKVPPEMDLRDIKNRQIRRTTSKSLFPASDTSDGAVQVTHSSDQRKSSWGVLGFLSCKGSASVAVTTPLTFLPRV